MRRHLSAALILIGGYLITVWALCNVPFKGVSYCQRYGQPAPITTTQPNPNQ